MFFFVLHWKKEKKEEYILATLQNCNVSCAFGWQLEEKFRLNFFLMTAIKRKFAILYCWLFCFLCLMSFYFYCITFFNFLKVYLSLSNIGKKLSSLHKFTLVWMEIVAVFRMFQVFQHYLTLHLLSLKICHQKGWYAGLTKLRFCEVFHPVVYRKKKKKKKKKLVKNKRKEKIVGFTSPSLFFTNII